MTPFKKTVSFLFRQKIINIRDKQLITIYFIEPLVYEQK